MHYFKKVYQLLFVVLVLSCSKEDETTTTTDDFEVSIESLTILENEIEINWEISKPINSIINNISIYRNDTFTASTLVVDQFISNTPSNATSYIDFDVPYTTSVSYTVQVRFSFESDGQTESLEVTSNRGVLDRDLVTFNNVPFQVERDRLEQNIYHIYDRNSTSKLVRYNTSAGKVSEIFNLGSGLSRFNKFQFRFNNLLVVTNTEGEVQILNTGDYGLISEFEVPDNEIIKAFAFVNEKFYYKGRDSFYYSYNLNTGENFRAPVGAGDILLSYDNQESVFYIISRFDAAQAGLMRLVDNCPSEVECNVEFVNQTGDINLQGFGIDGSNIDPNLFVINEELEIFISGRSGSVFSLNSFEQLSNFELLTNDKYFNFSIGSDNKIYAAVQAKKEIHVFDSQDYTLLERIPTITYPIHILLSEGNGNQKIDVVGTYRPLQYFSYGFGSNTGGNFDFQELAVIEHVVN